MVFIETPIFYRRVQQYMDDDEYGEMQAYLAIHPSAGNLIKGTGGMRKLRWAGSGHGKRGGLRVIYYWWLANDRITLLLIYPKNEQDNMTSEQLRQLKNQLVP